MNIHTKKGYLVLEAAIILPVFMIAVITTAFFMKAVICQEISVFYAVQEASLMAERAAYAHIYPQFPGKTERLIKSSLPYDKDIEIEDFSYIYKDKDKDRLISFCVRTGGKAPSENAFRLRGFLGKDNSGIYSSYRGEDDDDDSLVYVLPSYGRKYHKEGCIYIEPQPLQSIMSSRVRKKYTACSMCRPGNVNDGTRIYIFRYGGSYHRADCSAVKKYVLRMTKKDAEKRGYSPCSRCAAD